MYKNIIFDMGNVLIRFSPRRYVEMLGFDNKEEEMKVFNAVYANAYSPYLDRGDYTEEQFVDRVLENLPEKYRTYVETLIFHWADEVEPIKGMDKLIKELKDKGYMIYLLSNAGYRQHEYWLSIPGHDLFDGTVVSCDYKCIKPEAKIYKVLFDKFNLKPEECFFIDDLPINIYGASEMGMKGFVFHGDVEELREEFKKIGVL